MIIYLHGPDTYRSRQRVRFFREGFIKKYDPSGINVATLEGDKLSLDEFRQAAGAAGFLSKKRFIFIENFLTKNKNKKLHYEIAEYLEKEWNDENVLIFWEEDGEEGGSKKRTQKFSPLQTGLSRAKEEYYPFLKEQELQNWIQDEVIKRKGKIAPAAVLELSSLVGPDLWQLDQEIEKLIHFKKGKLITAEDVRQLVHSKFDENIFHLTDALSQKNAALSLKLINNQLELGVHELYILTMLVRQFRIMLQVKEILDKGESTYLIASTLGLHPFVAQKAIRDTRRFSMEELKQIYKLLLDIDVKIKTTQANPELLFDLLVMKVCGKA